jgi:hypothetical protein
VTIGRRPRSSLERFCLHERSASTPISSRLMASPASSSSRSRGAIVEINAPSGGSPIALWTAFKRSMSVTVATPRSAYCSTKLISSIPIVRSSVNVAVRHEGVALPFRVFDKIQTVAPGAIVENKRLGAALAFARELQASYPPNRRRGDPRRQRPPNNLEAPGMPTKGRAPRDTAAAAEAASRRVASDARQPVCSRSAEPSYEPSELELAR